jgi:hypothetical protein
MLAFQQEAWNPRKFGIIRFRNKLPSKKFSLTGGVHVVSRHQQGVMPVPAKTNNSELFSNLLPEIAQGLPKTFIPLLHAPQFERIVELIDFGDLDPFPPDVVQSPTCRQKVVDAHEHLELPFRRG